MRGGTLKRQSLVFKDKPFGRRGNSGGVFEVNQDPLSSEENDYREAQRDNARKQMRHFFPGGGTHDGIRSYYRDLTPQSNFTSVFSPYGLFLTLAAISTIFPGIPSVRFLSRHQPDEISGRSIREIAAANRACVCSDAGIGGRSNR